MFVTVFHIHSTRNLQMPTKTQKTNVVPSKKCFCVSDTKPVVSTKKAFCILKETCPIFVTLFFGSTKSKFPSQDVFCSLLCVFINEYRTLVSVSVLRAGPSTKKKKSWNCCPFDEFQTSCNEDVDVNQKNTQRTRFVSIWDSTCLSEWHLVRAKKSGERERS